MPLTDKLHKKPARSKMKYWASRSYRESAEPFFLPLCKSRWQNLSSIQTDRSSPLHVQQQPQHQPVQGTNTTGFWEHFCKRISGGNQPPSQNSYQPPFFFWHLPTPHTTLCVRNLRLLVGLKNWPLITGKRISLSSSVAPSGWAPLGCWKLQKCSICRCPSEQTACQSKAEGFPMLES